MPYALHFGFTTPDSTADEALRVVLNAPHFAGAEVTGAYRNADSFIEWGEAVRSDADALAAFGRTDRYHGTVYFIAVSDTAALAAGRAMYRALVSTGIADPTADCSPGHWDETMPYAVTNSDDWSVLHGPMPAATVRLELTPAEAGALEAFIYTSAAVHHGHYTRSLLTEVRTRLHDALTDLRAVTV